jgi:hypothetical protein
MEDHSDHSDHEDPKDPKFNKNLCYYEDIIDGLKAGGIIGYYEDRIAKLEAVIARLLRVMPALGKPD